ncbi:uncharacterized protein LOC116591991 [Mustela erminea]|uniref:uncharacterized protein LOC116591991 n=1 Tax=Mustela erminea TaxID=36723 RepID=UPI00138705EA|nr:uncharacterized protein LOC116591991 [Mustela erminea]
MGSTSRSWGPAGHNVILPDAHAATQRAGRRRVLGTEAGRESKGRGRRPRVATVRSRYRCAEAQPRSGEPAAAARPVSRQDDRASGPGDTPRPSRRPLPSHAARASQSQLRGRATAGDGAEENKEALPGSQWHHCERSGLPVPLLSPTCAGAWRARWEDVGALPELCQRCPEAINLPPLCLISTDLPLLDNSHEWNPTIPGLFGSLLSLSIMSSGTSPLPPEPSCTSGRRLCGDPGRREKVT